MNLLGSSASWMWAGALALYLVFVVLAARRGVFSRRALAMGSVLGALPALYAGLVWAGLVPDAYLRLARPWCTWAGAYASLFIAWRLASQRVSKSRFRALASDLVTTTAAVACAFAAAGAEIGRPLDRLAILIAIDRSRSIDLVPSAPERVARELRAAEVGMREDDRIGTIAFASEAVTEDPLRPRSSLGAPQKAAIGRDGTDVAAAIRRALAEVPPDAAARIVLVTDGVATRGDALSAAAAAVAAGIPVDVLPLEQRALPDVRVVAVRAPSRADEGEPFDLRLVTSSPAPAEIEVRVRLDGELIAKANAKIAAGEDVLRVKQKAPGPGLHRYDLEITALDPKLDETPEDNAGSAFLRVRGEASALVLEGDPGQGAFVAKSLEAAAFRVEQGGASRVPADLGGFAAYDVVVLSDVRASDLSVGQLEAIAAYVRDLGGGLILMGGDRGMGPGGYAKTPVEEISPVSFDLKQEKRRASLAEVIGIDISGSMGAHVGPNTKLDLANEAAARSAALLGAGDELGVEHVDTDVHWSVPLGPVTDGPAIERAIRGVGVGGGGIYVDITLDAGYAALEKDKVNLKHMLLFADGSDAEKKEGCRTKVTEALRRGITTSIVAMGNGSDVPELELLSRLGNGRFYLVEDATRLPAVFAQETILASRAAVVEKPFRVALTGGSSVMTGIDVGEAPPLEGYVVTIAKPRASVLLTGIEGDPVLATWGAGVGRAAAFTSDMKDRWGAAWTHWPGAARLLAQVARDVSRKAEDARVRLEADASGGSLHMRATVVGDDGRAETFRRLVARVVGPGGFSRELPLEASGAGSYQAEVPLSRPGTYVVVARDEDSGKAVATTGAALGTGEELRPTGTDFALLGRIAEFTNGKRRDTLAGIFSDRASRRFAYDDVTRALVIAAAALLWLAVAARRISMPEAVARFFSALRPNVVRSRAEPSSAAASALLLKKRERSERADAIARTAPVAAPVEQAIARSPDRPPPTGTTANITSPRPIGVRPPLRPAARPAPRSDGSPPSSRQLTAAEILLARRKGAKRS